MTSVFGGKLNAKQMPALKQAHIQKKSKWTIFVVNVRYQPPNVRVVRNSLYYFHLI